MAIKSQVPIGSIVSTTFGRAVVKQRRGDGSFKLLLEDWTLAKGAPVHAYLQADQFVRLDRKLEEGAVVETDFKMVGVVMDIRAEDNTCEIDLGSSWMLASNSRPTAYCQPENLTVVGKRVQTQYGPGFVEGFRKEDGMFHVVMDWKLANGSVVNAFVPTVDGIRPDRLTYKRLKTNYGKGFVEKVRPEDDMCVVSLEWELTGGSVATAFMPKSALREMEGEKVHTFAGPGTIEELREDGVYVIELDNWKLAGGNVVRCYEPDATLQTPLHEMNGQRVSTLGFGMGVVSRVRSDNMAEVKLDWKLANGSPAVAFTKTYNLKNIKGKMVSTSFGLGVVEEVRSDGSIVVELIQWKLAAGNKVKCYLHEGDVVDMIGHRVSTPQGPGTIQDIRQADGMYEVLLDWKLAGGTHAVAYVQSVEFVTGSPHVGRKVTWKAESAVEEFGTVVEDLEDGTLVVAVDGEDAERTVIVTPKTLGTSHGITTDWVLVKSLP